MTTTPTADGAGRPPRGQRATGTLFATGAALLLVGNVLHPVDEVPTATSPTCPTTASPDA